MTYSRDVMEAINAKKVFRFFWPVAPDDPLNL